MQYYRTYPFTRIIDAVGTAIWTTNFLGPIPDESVAKLKGFVASLGVVDKNLSEGAATSLVAALDPSLEDKNGVLLLDCQPYPLRSEVSQKEELPEKLWRLSEKLVNETFACVKSVAPLDRCG